jgi:hypothetical protein
MVTMQPSLLLKGRMTDQQPKLNVRPGDQILDPSGEYYTVLHAGPRLLVEDGASDRWVVNRRRLYSTWTHVVRDRTRPEGKRTPRR